MNDNGGASAGHFGSPSRRWLNQDASLLIVKPDQLLQLRTLDPAFLEMLCQIVLKEPSY